MKVSCFIITESKNTENYHKPQEYKNQFPVSQTAKMILDTIITGTEAECAQNKFSLFWVTHFQLGCTVTF
jgi:hypothetical protein